MTVKDGIIAYAEFNCKILKKTFLPGICRAFFDWRNPMKIDNQLLTISNYNRPGTIRPRTTAVACHYIGNPGTSAQANRNYFEGLRTTRVFDTLLRG